MATAKKRQMAADRKTAAKNRNAIQLEKWESDRAARRKAAALSTRKKKQWRRSSSLIRRG